MASFLPRFAGTGGHRDFFVLLYQRHCDSYTLHLARSAAARIPRSNIQIVVRTEGHCSRQKQSSGNFLNSFVSHLHYFASEWRRKQIIGRVFQGVRVSVVIERRHEFRH